MHFENERAIFHFEHLALLNTCLVNPRNLFVPIPALDYLAFALATDDLLNL
jgi:hypothetical protein